jgi:hypothetical protein
VCCIMTGNVLIVKLFVVSVLLQCKMREGGVAHSGSMCWRTRQGLVVGRPAVA